MKKYFFIITIAVLVLTLIRCEKTENVLNLCDSEIQNAISDEWVPDAIRYNVESEDGYTTYIVSDVKIIEEFIDVFEQLEITERENNYQPDKKASIVLCGLTFDSNGGVDNYEITICDGRIELEDGYYPIIDNSALNEIIKQICEAGEQACYDDFTVDNFNKLFRFWGGDTIELGFSQDIDGFYYMSLFSTGNNDYPDDKIIKIITIKSTEDGLEIQGITDSQAGIYTLRDIDEDSLSFAGETLHRLMME